MTEGDNCDSEGGEDGRFEKGIVLLERLAEIVDMEICRVSHRSSNNEMKGCAV
jgi:hypothetical protein